MKKNYFKEYLKIAPLSHALWRAQEAKSLENVKLKEPILDLGCGFGEFAGVFFEGMIEIGIDVSQDDLIKAAKLNKYKNLIWADARKLPFENNSFQTIISISTLEHIKNVEKVFLETYRVLKNKGILIVTVPTTQLNKKFMIPRIIKLLKLNYFYHLYIKAYHSVFNHEVVLSKNKWLSIIKKAGFKIVECKGTMSDIQVRIFEIFLLTAAPTQFFKLLFKKRLPVSPKLRVNLILKLFEKIGNDKQFNESNIIIIARK